MSYEKKKKKGLGLGKRTINVLFRVKDTLGIFGMERDNNLGFSGHQISNVRKKINSQLNV